MKLTVLASGSKANCYVIQNNSEALIIEAGVSFKEVQKSLDFNISKVAGCLITHEHSDHCKYVNSFLKYEIDVYASIGTISKLNISKNKKPIELIKYQCNKIGNFLVFPFDTNHDYEEKVKEPIGFYIMHKEIGSLLFATDTYYLKDTFPNLNFIMIEANYITSILDDNYKKGVIDDYLYRRIKRSHMSLDTLITTLKANDLTNVHKIVLLHLSDNNSEKQIMKRTVELATGKQTYIAEKNLVININKSGL